MKPYLLLLTVVLGSIANTAIADEIIVVEENRSWDSVWCEHHPRKCWCYHHPRRCY